MVQVRILSGQMAGTDSFVQRFPCVIGRSPQAHLRLEEPGVWDSHLQIDLTSSRTFTLSLLCEAKVLVNGQPCESVALKNGDVIDIGAAKVQFWLSQVQQRRTVLRERLTWAAIAVLCLGQVLLIYKLLQ